MTSNLRNVAKAAGVSLSTASRVFTNAANVSEEARSRVLAVSAELGYRPRERARRQEATILQKVVLFVRAHNRVALPSMLGDFYGYILQGVEAECRRQRLTMLFAHDDGDSLANQLTALDTDDETGILLVGPFTSDDVAAVQEQQLPVVLLNNVVDQPVDAVLPDYYAGAQQAVHHLIAAGHRRIAYLHGRERYTTHLRLQGYIDTMREAGLDYDPHLVIRSSMSPQSASDAVRELLQRDRIFTALFCINDISAYGATVALLEAGLQPGEDVSLVGFDDIDLSNLTKFQLTTIHVPKMEMGAVAVRRLSERAANPEGAPQRIILGVHLIERESVKRVTSDE